MWKELMSDISPIYTFSKPINEDAMSHIEKQLNVEFPAELKSLLFETDGIVERHDYAEWFLLWSSDVILRENLQIRSSEVLREFCQPFDNLLFFADSGCGDFFGFLIEDGVISTTDIYVWNHEDDSRPKVASSLKEFVVGWVNGKIVF